MQRAGAVGVGLPVPLTVLEIEILYVRRQVELDATQYSGTADRPEPQHAQRVDK